MKHSAMDMNISQARQSSMAAQDRVRNTTRQCEQTNVVSIVQQNCLTEQEVTSECDSGKFIPTGSANTNIKWPGTSVRQMQQRSKSMTSDNKEPVSNSGQNRISEDSQLVEPDRRNPALRRSQSMSGLAANRENSNFTSEKHG